MSRAKFALAALVALLLLPAPSLATAKVLRANLNTISDYEVDNEPVGPSAGDLSGSEGVLRKGGEEVGRFMSACTHVTVNAGICQGSFLFSRRGEIYVAGRFRPDAQRHQVPILGGTREFRGAGGTLTVQRTPNPDVERLAFRFSR